MQVDGKAPFSMREVHVNAAVKIPLMSHARPRPGGAGDALSEVKEVQPLLDMVPNVDKILDVHVKLLVVLLDVKNIFEIGLLLTVINFVPTICDVVLFAMNSLNPML